MSPTALPRRVGPAPKASVVPDPRDRLHVATSIPFFLIHLAALVGVFLVPFHFSYVLVALGLYYVRMFGVTAGYHRYFAHRSYKTSRVFQFLLAWLAESSVQKGVLWWSGHHRDHHRDSDTPADIHSPVQRGFWWSHVGWILSSRYDEAPLHRIRDFERFPELRFISKHYWLPPTVLGLGLCLVGGWPLVVWGFCVSTVLLWHGTFTINSLSHVFGKRRYPTSDDSRNNWLLALVTMGEGWHNNHHHFAAAARQGFYWWEIDLSYYVLRALAAVGLVWDLKQPSPKVLAEGRARGKAGQGEISDGVGAVISSRA
jgi:stearoyl-CoA desaturase (Delta-9 desaturase)